MCEWELWLWVWIQFTGLTLPLRITLMNNPITLITSTVPSSATFFAADSICVALQISEQFSPKARTPAHSLDADLEPDFNAKWPFKVIRFSVNEQPLRGYIVQYNWIVALNVKVRKIYRAKQAKIAIYDHPTLILCPLSSKPPRIFT